MWPPSPGRIVFALRRKIVPNRQHPPPAATVDITLTANTLGPDIDGAVTMTRKDLHNFRQERRRRIRELRGQGWTTKQIAAVFAREYSESPLKAFRWVYDWTLAEACEHFNNEVADDAEQEALSWRRLSCYENWPRSAGSSPPSVPLLRGLARLYQCAVGDLVEGGDYTPEPPRGHVHISSNSPAALVRERVDGALEVSRSVAPRPDDQQVQAQLDRWPAESRLQQAAAPAAEEPGPEASEAIGPQPTLLRVLVGQRHWRDYETFAREYERAANQLAEQDQDPGLRGLTVARRLYERWLSGSLQTRPYPDHCRVLEHLFGFPVDQLFAPASQQLQPETPNTRAILAASPESGSAVQRRDFNRLVAAGGLAAAGVVAKVITPGVPDHQQQRMSMAGQIQHIRDRLMRYESLDGTPRGEPVTLQALQSSVTDAWRAFQESDYSTLARQLPTLIDDSNLAEHTFDGAAGFRARELLSETLQLTAILLLKQGDSNLGWVAADRSMLAAERADSPLTFASAARILAYALLGALHFDQAKDLSLRVADHLEQESGLRSPEVLSAYGALVLKAAMATAMQDDRATTTELLNTAASTAERLGHDGNHLWTAFGPTNVTVHYVSAAVALGDAGVATHHASQVQLDRLPVLERRAHHLIDVSRAFGQRSKNDQALSALLDAEQLAPEEVRVSPEAQALVVELLHRSVRRVPELRALAYRLQVPA
jgi:hypothetical protein